jgi:UDP-glucose 4-epimerase
MANKRVLVTGVAGFLGSNLLPRLLESGYTVVGLDNLGHGRLDRVSRHVGDRFQFIEGDVRDHETVGRAARGVGHIVHFAEVKIPRYGQSLETLEVNVQGTEHVLDAAVEQGARFILGSTDEVYGKNTENPLNEESALVMGQSNVNRWSLGVSKLMAEQLSFAYHEKHGVPVTILRYFGGYGPQQSLDWMGGPQSVFITAALRRETVPIHGDGLQSRTFTNIADLVEGTILAMESPYSEGEILNVASRDTLSMINLAYLVWRLVGNAEKPKLEFVPYTDFSRNYEDVRQRSADISKVHYLLGFEPKVALIEGLKETIRWQAEALGVELNDARAGATTL